jgi:hypothetical protein
MHRYDAGRPLSRISLPVPPLFHLLLIPWPQFALLSHRTCDKDGSIAIATSLAAHGAHHLTPLGVLARAGMVDSKEFAEGIFDALARRRRQNLERITKEELYDFWLQISDQSFDARLQIFFDMY